MNTNGTEHLSMNEFAQKMQDAVPGEYFEYAVGDLAFSIRQGQVSSCRELIGVKRMAWELYDRQGKLCLAQRRLSFASYQYLAMKPRPEFTEYHEKQAALRSAEDWRVSERSHRPKIAQETS